VSNPECDFSNLKPRKWLLKVKKERDRKVFFSCALKEVDEVVVPRSLATGKESLIIILLPSLDNA
jgi:hypothetical protein